MYACLCLCKRQLDVHCNHTFKTLGRMDIINEYLLNLWESIFKNGIMLGKRNFKRSLGNKNSITVGVLVEHTYLPHYREYDKYITRFHSP